MSTEIYFYINVRHKIAFLCKLLREKILENANNIVILTKNDRDWQEELTQALWTTIPNSFLANEILTKDNQASCDTPIKISNSLNWINNIQTQVLIDLTSSQLENIMKFQKIIYIFNKDERELNQARQLYTHYRSLKTDILLKHFDINLIKKTT